jgi:hypothetical protein
MAAQSPRTSGRRRLPTRRRQVWIAAGAATVAVIGVTVAILVSAPLKVTAVYAYPVPARIPACRDSVSLLGTIFINHRGGGSVSYEWIRPDGTISRTSTLYFPMGDAFEHVQMTWVFPQSENGVMVSATLKVLSPNTMSASAPLFYSCF